MAVPSPRSFSGTAAIWPSGAVISAARLVGLRLWRKISSRRLRMRASRYSSSRSGSFISQCETRRSISACGPPPSKPRSHSQAWSDRRLGDTALADPIQNKQRFALQPAQQNMAAHSCGFDLTEPAAPGLRPDAGAGEPGCYRVALALTCPLGAEALSIHLSGRPPGQQRADRRMRQTERSGVSGPGRHHQGAAPPDIVGDVLQIVARITPRRR